nr:unnamed protein product [Callosobruchus chinensis]
MCVKVSTCFKFLFRLLDNRFLPPPAKVKQTVDDLVLDEGGQVLDLPVNLALRLSTTLKDFLQMPYDDDDVWSLSLNRHIEKMSFTLCESVKPNIFMNFPILKITI